jgi:phage baseplate assembly protein W
MRQEGRRVIWKGSDFTADPVGHRAWIPRELPARDDLKRARLVLEIVPGERRLLPEFGCRIHLLPSIATEAERHLAAALVEEALDLWVPYLRIDRAEVLGVEGGWIRLALRTHGSWSEMLLKHRAPTSSGRWDLQAEEEEPGGTASTGRAEGMEV